MAKTNNTIHLNGKRYDAVTGALVSATTVTHRAMSGDIRRPSKPSHHNANSTVRSSVPKPQTAAVAIPQKTTKVMDVRRAPAGHIKHHKPETSKTLMRKVVKKPAPSLKRTAKSQPRTDILAKTPAHVLVPKASMHHIDPIRLKRAEQIAKNNLVSRFGQVTSPVIQHTHQAAHQLKHDVDTVIAGVSSELSAIQPVFAAGAATAARPSMDIFEQALARANSHRETYVDPKKAHRAAKRKGHSTAKRLARSGSLALAVLLIAGFIAYQNSANITMRVAAHKAGFSASMPSFKPSGFAVGKFTYGAGYVAVNYHSNSDKRAFSLTQKVSSWDSEALLNEFVSNAAGNSYQALQASGRTIYTYGNNNATWVDHGVWFNIQSNGSLSTAQLVNLATSM